MGQGFETMGSTLQASKAEDINGIKLMWTETELPSHRIEFGDGQAIDAKLGNGDAFIAELKRKAGNISDIEELYKLAKSIEGPFL
jgi:hypothetical protein